MLAKDKGKARLTLRAVTEFAGAERHSGHAHNVASEWDARLCSLQSGDRGGEANESSSGVDEYSDEVHSCGLAQGQRLTADLPGQLLEVGC